jgi:ferredoxin--NADP+ reductase
VPVQAIYRAVGYFGSELDGVPYDAVRGVIPNHEGQVVDADNNVVPGVYATGWIKRGPVGLIGHTKSDAMETVSHLVKDQRSWWSPAHPEESAIVELLESRGVAFTNLDGWHRLDDWEKTLGEAAGRERIKVVPRDDMIAISRGESV